jgi:tetratricopeptide (TPR) repeat protein
MNIIDRIREWINLQPSAAPPQPDNSPLRKALEDGQRAKYAENYSLAAETFNRALQIARSSNDALAMAVVSVNQADTFISQRRFSEADEILRDSYRLARESGHRGQMAYILTELGYLEQQQDHWTEARDYYEQAIQTAREGRAVGAEGRAQGHLAATYLHEANASYASHLLREALPKLNMGRDLELSSYFVGLMGEAFIQTGQEIEGQQMLDRALRLAKQMSYRKYERRWHLRLGERALHEGRFSDAQTHYQGAAECFDKTNPTPEYISILCQLSQVSLNQRELDTALRYAREAVEVSQFLEDESLITQAKGSLGMALLANHNSAEALPYLEAVAASYQSQANGGVAEMNILRHLAAAQAESGAMDAAVATYRRAAERAEKQDARLELAQTRRDLGLIFAQQRQMQAAVQEWTAALTIYEAQKQPGPAARLYCDLASARRYLGQGQRAMKDYEQALMALNALDNDWETRGVVLSNAANAYVDQGDIESADSFFNEAIAIARRLGNEADETTRRGNYGWFLIAIGRPQQAISALEYALRMSNALKLELQAAIQTDNLGTAYDLMGHYARAMDYHRQAIERISALNNPSWENRFKVNLGNTLLSLGQTAFAIPLFDDALAQARQDEDIELIARALTGQARIALHLDRPETASALLEEATTIARRADFRRVLAEALSAASEQQAALDQPERAAAVWEEARKLFTMLHMPQAKTQPAWLNGKVVSSK